MMRADLGRAPNRLLERGFVGLCFFATMLPIVVLALLLGDVVVTGIGRVSWDFLTSFPSRNPEQAGIYPAVVGSVLLVTLTAAFSLPVGIATAIYLEEYGKRGRIANIVEINIANLAGVPSIIYGLLGLEVFVRFLGFGRSLLAGALTLGLLVLPIVIMASREALRTVPLEMREAGLALGATQWRTVRSVVLPMALPGILTGSILSVSRAIGEAAPLVMLGAAAAMNFVPDGLFAPFTALPIQIFNWTSRPQAGFAVDAAAGIIVLMITLLVMNGLAIWLRHRVQRRIFR
jgi:phosphate transport system permease protein